MSSEDFPGGPVVKTLCASNAGGEGSIPNWGTKIPHASRRGPPHTHTQKKMGSEWIDGLSKVIDTRFSTAGYGWGLSASWVSALYYSTRRPLIWWFLTYFLYTPKHLMDVSQSAPSVWGLESRCGSCSHWGWEPLLELGKHPIGIQTGNPGWRG